MRVIAFYLPQFHEIDENNQWWGKGFTEWTNVKKTVPRFKGHNQPRIPYRNNYYNLLDDNVMEEQAKIATSYGVDAFCFYHYWFKGKKLLEKPVERFLQNKDAKIDFCLSWANESWSRNWDGGNQELLIEQNYGDYNDWAQHYEYFNEFFKDERYIKIDNKPLLIIYKPQLITNCKEMISCFNDLAKKNGFDGIYLGHQHSSSFYSTFPKEDFSFGVQFEPWFTIDERLRNPFKKYNNEGIELNNKLFREKVRNFISKRLFKVPSRFSYEYISEQIANRKVEPNVMKGCFPDWDNSPRHITDLKGCVITGSSPKAFKKMITDILKDYNNEFLFINAWNEWAEGAYLEPDGKYKYEYLEALKKGLSK